ncbi:MAG: protein kinase [bacterium]|nr:protein kinase [bacterium]
MTGRSLLHYRILEKLGAGGMGDVYLAEDRRLKRRVALKVLPKEFAALPERLNRFRREAEAVAALSHPNIVTIHSVEEAEGVHFLTMELLQGKTLARLIPRGGLPVRRFFEIAVPLVDALVAAHERRIVHRDLKPTNVMVSDRGVVKVLDFGLAILRREPESSDADELPTVTWTEEGRIQGTVPYMSPEQIRGAWVGPESDIFSLGVVLYEMATGRRPFQGETSADVVSAVLRHEPRPVTDLRPELPYHLGRIIGHCLVKDPKHRFRSTQDLRDELEALREEVESGQIRSGALSSAELAASKPKRRRRWLAAALAVVALLAVGSWYLTRESEEPSWPVSYETQELLNQAHHLEQRGDTQENLAAAEERYRRALALEPGRPEIQARLAAVLARLQLKSADAERADEIRRLTDQALEEDSDQGMAYVALGRLSLLEGDAVSADKLARRAIEATPEDYCAYTLLGQSLVLQDRPDEGLRQLREGVIRAGADIRARLALARELMRLGRFHLAAAEYELVRESDPDSQLALNNLAILYARSGRDLDAIPLLKRLLTLGDDDAAAVNLGMIYLRQDRAGEAVEAFLDAYRMNPDKPLIPHSLGEAYEKLEDFETAREWFATAIDSYDRDLAAGGRRSWLGLRAVCAAKLARFDEALQNLREVLELAPNDPDPLFNAAQVHALAGDRERTLDYVQLAFEAGYPRQEFLRDLSFRAFWDDPEFLDLLEAEPGL